MRFNKPQVQNKKKGPIYPILDGRKPATRTTDPFGVCGHLTTTYTKNTHTQRRLELGRPESRFMHPRRRQSHRGLAFRRRGPSPWGRKSDSCDAWRGRRDRSARPCSDPCARPSALGTEAQATRDVKAWKGPPTRCQGRNVTLSPGQPGLRAGGRHRGGVAEPVSDRKARFFGGQSTFRHHVWFIKPLMSFINLKLW